MPPATNDATTVQLSPVGRSDLVVPPFSLGTGPLGELRSFVPEEVAQAILAAAWNGGVRSFDTAGWYGRGLAEHRLGTFLRGKQRADYVLTTKVGRTLHRPANPAGFDRSPWVGGLNFDVAFDYSYDGIMRSFDQALQRLGIETVDGIAIHDLDSGFLGDAFDGHRRALLDSGARALAEIKAAGMVRAVGMGFNLTPELDLFVNALDLDYALVAHPYTLLDQGSLHLHQVGQGTFTPRRLNMLGTQRTRCAGGVCAAEYRQRI